jgi:hypothetical protein
VNFEDELQKLKDAMTVEMALSERYRTRQLEHQAWIEANEAALQRYREANEAAYAYHQAWLIELDERLDRISKLLEGKIRGENGNQ